MQSLEWTVSNFSEIMKNTRKLQFRNNSKNEHKFSLLIRLRHHDDSVEIYYMYKHIKSVSLTFELYVNSRNINLNVPFGPVNKITIPGGEWQCISTHFIKQFACYYPKNNSSLHLKFDYRIIDIDANSIENSKYMKQLLSNDKFSPIITIRNAEGKEHKVHKELLAVRSPVFKAQFEHNTIECQTKIIETHLEKEVLDELLIFMYYSQVSSDWDMCNKLLAAADFYQIDELKSMCETVLYGKLSPENAIETLVHADLYSAVTLKKLTLEFIKFEPNIEIKDEEWTKLKSMEILKDLCKCLLDTNVICFDTAK